MLDFKDKFEFNNILCCKIRIKVINFQNKNIEVRYLFLVTFLNFLKNIAGLSGEINNESSENKNFLNAFFKETFFKLKILV